MSKIFKAAKDKEGVKAPFILDSDALRGMAGLESIEQERRKSLEMRRRLELRSQAVERESYERGFAAGEKAGFELGRQKAEGLFNKIGEMIEELSSLKETAFKDLEGEIIELTLALADKIASREIDADDEAVISNIKRAMQVASTTGDIIVKVNPRDRDVLFKYKEDLARYGVGVEGVRIETDDSVARGGCFLETSYGVVDATVHGIIGELKEKLDDEL
ncbi:hypothetical protein MNBD_DELTA02-777 [hydrothermal vent metagenome]|uniref:Flagellar assembly protein FliH/Type III secretion system HrpE domain-containing protein n=1 Tax=hydrothermal vent metagenome TaxID=652676 RepID=A0A3B0VCH2_9ZZZZ